MKKALIFIPLFLFASNGVLSDLKERMLQTDRLKSEYSASETKKSWINPVIIQYQFLQNNSIPNTLQRTRTFTISVNQPVFKSGAIYYSIKYADNLKKFNEKQLELQKRELIKQALDLVYDYRINRLNEEMVELNIKNAQIDVEKKKEDFLSGSGDSSFLNQAIINLNNTKLSLEDLKFNEKQLKYSFSNLSDLNIEKVKLPVFKIISQNEFLNKNLQLISSRIDNKIKYDLYKMQLGNQLLSVNLNASYTNQKINYSNQSMLYQNSKNRYYNVGFSITLPLSVTAYDKVEQTKLEYLKSKLQKMDTKRSLINTYKMIISQIQTLKKKKNIYAQNAKLYEKLIDSTKESIAAGSATKYDLEILQNSLKVMYINQKIIDYQIQKLLLNLYYQTTSAI